MLKKNLEIITNPRNLLLAFLFVIGLVDNKFFSLGSSTRNVILVSFLLVIAFLYIREQKGKSIKFLFKKFSKFPNIYITLYLLWGLVTVFFAVDKTTTLLYVLGGFVVFLVGFIMVKELYSPQLFKKSLYVISLVSLPAVIYSSVRLIIQVINTQLVSTIALVNINLTETLTIFNVPFLSSYYKHPNTFGIILFFSIATTITLLFLEKRKNFRIFLYFLLILYTPFVFFTLSRSALLAVGAFTLLVSGPALKRKIYFILVVAVIFVASFLLFIFNDWGLRVSSGTPAPFSQRITTSQGDKLDLKDLGEEEIFEPKKISKRGTSNRIVIWTASVDYIKQNPIFGAGFGSSVEAIRSYIPDLYARYRGLTPHNTYLRILVESGVVGLGIYVTIVANLFILAIKKFKNLTAQEWLILSILASVLAYQFFETSFLLGTSFRSFYFLVFLSIGFYLLATKDLGKGGR
ncbi:MAG: O-antigen ligase family protein [Candidatus Woykebacteria bacterium]